MESNNIPIAITDGKDEETQANEKQIRKKRTPQYHINFRYNSIIKLYTNSKYHIFITKTMYNITMLDNKLIRWYAIYAEIKRKTTVSKFL